MKIGLYFNDMGFSGLDLKEPQKGNNGIGGTQYCFLMLGDSLIKYTNNEVIFFHYNYNNLPDGIISIAISDKEDLVKKAISTKVDFLIFKAEGVTPFIKSIRGTKLSCIAWAHNYLLDEELNELKSNANIKRIVFVGREQYDRYVDHDIISKSTYIYNMFDGRCFNYRENNNNHNVTYTGSLVRSKGFHILASVWPEIVNAVPDAQLYVIGSGQLYDRNAKLGNLGVADEKFEASFAPYITKDGKIMPSVHFLGTLGKEKTEVYNNTSVGVINPSGKTETFGLSAIEMEACGIPVITKAANGLYDTVIPNTTGYLVHNKRQLRDKVIKLLLDNEKNYAMGKNAKAFADSQFLPEKIVIKWEELFQNIKHDKQEPYIAPNNNYCNNLKWLRIIIRNLRKSRVPISPLINLECHIRRLVSK